MKTHLELCPLLIQLCFNLKSASRLADVISVLKLCSNSSVPCFSIGQVCDVLNVTENNICCKTPPKPIMRSVYPGKLPEERMAISMFIKEEYY